MRKILMLILCLGMLIALAACSKEGDSGDDDAQRTSAASQGAEESSAPYPSYVTTPERYIDIEVLVDENEELINNYSVMAINPDAAFAEPAPVEEAAEAADAAEAAEAGEPAAEAQEGTLPEGEQDTAEPEADEPVEPAEITINSKGAEQLINWLYSAEGKKAAEEYGVENHGQAMFQFRDNAPAADAVPEKATDETRYINLGVTSSMYESMLLNELIPMFEQEYEYIVDLVPASTTAKALEAAKAGKVDLIIVQSVPETDAFAEEGFGYTLPGFDSANLAYVYNYLVLCGPSNDPAMVKDAASLSEAFANIAEGKYRFISRGDSGDINLRELGFWPEGLAITADPESYAGYSEWYTPSGTSSMYAGLSMAEDMEAYILADKSSFYNLKSTSVGEPPSEAREG